MRFFTQAAALAALAKLALAQGTLFINTPASLVECQPSLLSFGGGSSPYFLSVLPAGQATATPILTLPDQQAAEGTYTWNVNLPAGTNITLQVRDGTGAVNYGSPVVIQAGTSTSCIDAAGASSASSLSATGAVTTTAGGAATTAGSTSSVSQSTGSSVVTSTGSATSAVTAASGTPSTTASTNSTSGASGNFTCSEGLLTYGISIASLGDASLTQAIRFFNNLTASQPTAVNVSGTEVNFQVANLTYAFNVTLNDTTSTSVHQQLTFLGTDPVDLGNGTLLYDAFEDLTVYRNSTSNETEVQYFILGCFSDQPAGITILGQIISSAINYWSRELSNSTSSSAAAVRRTVRLF